MRDEGWIWFIADRFWSTNCEGLCHTAVPTLRLSIQVSDILACHTGLQVFMDRPDYGQVDTWAPEIVKEFDSYPAWDEFSKMLFTTLKTQAASVGAPLLCPPFFVPCSH